MTSLIDEVTGAAARNTVRTINEQLHGCDRMETTCRDLMHANQIRRANLLAQRGELLAQYNMLDGVAAEAAAAPPPPAWMGAPGTPINVAEDFPPRSFSPPPFFTSVERTLDASTSQLPPKSWNEENGIDQTWQDMDALEAEAKGA